MESGVGGVGTKEKLIKTIVNTETQKQLVTHKAEVQKVKLLKITRRNRKRKKQERERERERKVQAITARKKGEKERRRARVAVVVYVQRAAFVEGQTAE